MNETMNEWTNKPLQWLKARSADKTVHSQLVQWKTFSIWAKSNFVVEDDDEDKDAAAAAAAAARIRHGKERTRADKWHLNQFSNYNEGFH